MCFTAGVNSLPAGHSACPADYIFGRQNKFAGGEAKSCVAICTRQTSKVQLLAAETVARTTTTSLVTSTDARGILRKVKFSLLYLPPKNRWSSAPLHLFEADRPPVTGSSRSGYAQAGCVGGFWFSPAACTEHLTESGGVPFP